MTRQEFMSGIDRYLRASEPVIAVRTSEPVRAASTVQNIIREYQTVDPAQLNGGKGCLFWTITKGMRAVEDLKTDNAPIFDGKPPQSKVSSLGMCLDEFTKENDGVLMGYNFACVFDFSSLIPQQPNPHAHAAMYQLINDYREYGLIRYQSEESQLTSYDGFQDDSPAQRKVSQRKHLILFIDPEFDMPASLASIPVLEFPLPDKDSLAMVMGLVFEAEKAKGSDFTQLTEEAIQQVAKQATGLTEDVIFSVLYSSIADYENRPAELDAQVLIAALAEHRMASVNDHAALSTLKHVPLEQIGGLEVLKEYLRKTAFAYTPTADELGMDKPKGMLALGTSGTGKTLSAQGIAHVLQVPAIKLDMSALYGGIVGDTEKNTASAIRLLKSIAPCVVLVDEVEKAMGNAHENNGGITARILSSFLGLMQDNEEGIFFVFTANRAHNLPMELTRAGRIDAKFIVDLPNRKEREAILEIHLGKRGLDVPENLQDVIAATEGFTAAELEAVVKEAFADVAYRTHTKDVTAEDLVTSASKMITISKSHPEQSEEIRRWGLENATNASLPDEEVAPTPRQRSRRNVASLR